MAKPSAKLAAERRRLRELRRSLPRDERDRAERAIARRIARLGVLRPGRRVAVYMGVRGEVRLDRVIRDARRRRVQLYAPRVLSLRRRSMIFLPLRADRALVRNPFGLFEPAATVGRGLAPSRLDVVLMPLVGFDTSGQRLGMGAGLYDRAFRHRLERERRWRRPQLIGIAFACQRVPAIEHSSWDVPLDLIVTETGVIRPLRSNT
jgi:5-formyltetrahydrofolate cyclo-ligase